MHLEHPAASDVFKGIAAGAIGGLAGALAMNQFSRLKKKLPGHGQGRQQSGEGEPATVKAARRASLEVLHKPLPDEYKEQAASAVHYLFGALAGASYGAAAEVLPDTRVALGTVFGAGLWLSADEVLVPALGLAKGPREYPVEVHASALASHLIYGLTTEVVRRAVRAAW